MRTRARGSSPRRGQRSVERAFPPEHGPSDRSELGHDGTMTFDGSGAPSSVFRICFVCTGNICRSPMAEVVFRDLAMRAGLDDRLAISSAGTGEWHVGEPADHRTIAALERRGFDGSTHRARQFDPDWFDDLELAVVFDRNHDRTLRAWAHSEADRSKVALLLGFDHENTGQLEVPDPYYSDAAMFDRVLAQIERACASLLAQVEPGIRQKVH